MDGEKPKANRGGRRPGAGRPPKEIRQVRDQVNRAMDAIVIPELEEVFRSLVREAKGEVLVDVWKLESEIKHPDKIILRGEDGELIRRTQPDGSREVLVNRVLTMTEPNHKAAIYLIDRYLGRPFQSVVVKDQGKKPDPNQSNLDAARRELAGDGWTTPGASDAGPSST